MNVRFSFCYRLPWTSLAAARLAAMTGRMKVGRSQKLLRRAWALLREACGEKDYARYRAYVAARGGTPESPRDFYLNKLHRKYSNPSRCC